MSKKKKPQTQRIGKPISAPEPQHSRLLQPETVRKAMVGEPPAPDPSKLDRLPVTYQEIDDYFRPLGKGGPVSLFPLRRETFQRIERVTGRPMICYVAKTHDLPQGVPAHIDDSDLTGFGDLVYSTPGDEVDVFIVSNGGSAETTERIVQLLRGRFKSVRFIVPANAYSAATLLCFSGDQIIMDSLGTLGPIDPQVNGIPARAILRAIENLEGRLKEEGPRALTAYMPLLSKYDLHILEMCRSAQKLSEELAGRWLSSYMLKCQEDNPDCAKITDFFSDYDIHKSHGRSISRDVARGLGLNVVDVESIEGLAELIRSLANQYEFFFVNTPLSPLYKIFENARGINWGRGIKSVMFQLPIPVPGAPQPVPQPGPPDRSG